MGVNGFVVDGGHVGGVFHGVTETVDCEEEFRTAGKGEFGPESAEDGPGDGGVGGAEEGKAVEGDVGLDGDGEGVSLREGEGGEEGGVGAGDV